MIKAFGPAAALEVVQLLGRATFMHAAGIICPQRRGALLACACQNPREVLTCCSRLGAMRLRMWRSW